MLLEALTLQVPAACVDAFERAFYAGQAALRQLPGYGAHELQRSLDGPGQYLLLIERQALAELPSPLGSTWWQTLQPFWAEPPLLQRYQLVAGLGIRTPPPLPCDAAD